MTSLAPRTASSSKGQTNAFENDGLKQWPKNGDDTKDNNMSLDPPRGTSSREDRRELEEEAEIMEGKMEDEVSAAAKSPKEIMIVPLYQSYGTYYVEMWIGTPSQRQTLIIDTASSQTYFPCSVVGECDECEEEVNEFDPTLSSSFRQLECDECTFRSYGCYSADENMCPAGASYEDGSSWSGFEATDVVSIGLPPPDDNNNDNSVIPSTSSTQQQHQLSHSFSCQTDRIGYFTTQPGILGLSKHSDYLNQLYENGSLPSKQFSLCFALEQQSVGMLTLGGIDTKLNSAPMAYTESIDPNHRYFMVYIRQIYFQRDLESEESSIQPKQTWEENNIFILDSASPFTYLHPILSDSFREEWVQSTGMEFTNEFVTLTEEQLLNMPDIIIEFKDMNSETQINLDPNIIITVPPSQYMMYNSTTNLYTNTFYLNSQVGNILGTNILQNHNILFDLEQSRIGISKSDCHSNYPIPINTKPIQIGVSDNTFVFQPQEQQSSPQKHNHHHYPKSSTGVSMFFLVLTIGILFFVLITFRMIQHMRRQRQYSLTREVDEIWFDVDRSIHNGDGGGGGGDDNHLELVRQKNAELD